MLQDYDSLISSSLPYGLSLLPHCSKHYHYTNPGTPIWPWSSIGEQQKPVRERERERIGQIVAVFCMTNLSTPASVHSFGDLPQHDM